MSNTATAGLFTPSMKFAIAVALVLGGATYAVHKTRVGDWTSLWRREPLTAIAPETGAAYTAHTGQRSLSSHEHPSPAQVLENDQIVGPSNALHADIREKGRGRFSFWHEQVYLSTSDNTDPRSNGRQYAIWYPPVSRTAARLLYAGTVAVWVVTGLLAVWRVRRSGVSWQAVVGELVRAGVTRVSRLLDGLSERAPSKRAVAAALSGVWVLVLALVLASETAYLTRTAQWTALWRVEPIGAIRQEMGFAYIAHTGRREIGSHDSPEPTALYEDGVQIGLRNAPHAEIREVGLGRYSFWHDQVYFAATDNSDPRTNGRQYTMAFPPVSRTLARMLYLVTFLALLSSVLLTGVAVRAGLLGAFPLAAQANLDRHLVSILAGASAASLVLAAVLRAYPGTAPLVTELWVPILLLNALSAWLFHVRFGRQMPKALIAVFLFALCVGLYFLTAWAPHRMQGCHTGDPYPAWDMFCVAPDSSSYYFKYTVGSTRQPLYPWFIEVLTANTDFSPQAYLASSPPGAIHTDEADPLMPVVRTQILLMLAGAVVACAGLMVLLGSPLPSAVMLWLYDMQYFTALELNIVLTETMVQAFLLMLLGAFAAFMGRKRDSALLLAGIACGLAYLTRQASAYGALLLLVMILVALFGDWRRWWKSCTAALVVFAALAAVPDIYAFVQTGSLGKNQESLQYQYRIAHAMQYATLDDVELMPDQESREWLTDAVKRRDLEHELVRERYADEYNRMVYYINANLYSVATPPEGYRGAQKSPQFFMAVATPILVRHWLDYLDFSFRFWRFGMAKPGLARLGLYGLSPWLTYLALGLLILWLRDLKAVAAATLVLAHAGAVALTCLFAVPIPRMVWASEFLVVVAGMVLVCGGAERLSASPAGAVALGWITDPIGSRQRAAALERRQAIREEGV